MAKILVEKTTDKQIKIRFAYAPELVEKIKKINGRSWHPEEKYWTIPEKDEAVQQLLLVFAGDEISIDPRLRSIVTPLFLQQPAPGKIKSLQM